MTDRPYNFLTISIRPWGLLTAAGIVASVATVLGFLGRFSWLLDLFSHFRVQYMLGLLVLGVVLFIGRRSRTASAFLLLACVNIAPVLPLYFGKGCGDVSPQFTIEETLCGVHCAHQECDGDECEL